MSAAMAQRRELRTSLRHLEDLVLELPECVAETSNAVKALFDHFLEFAAESEMEEAVIDPTTWSEVHNRLRKLEMKAPWTAGGTEGLRSLQQVLDSYGCGIEKGHEIEAKAWCDKIIFAVQNQLARIPPTPEPSRLSSASLLSKKRWSPSKENRLNSPTVFPRIEAAARHINNLPVVSRASTSVIVLIPTKRSLQTQPSSTQSSSSTLQKLTGPPSRPDSADSESELSDLELSSPDTSDAEQEDKPVLKLEEDVEKDSKGKGKAREPSDDIKPLSRQSSRTRSRSAGPSPHPPEKKPKLEHAPERKPAILDYSNPRLLSTEDRIRTTLPLPADLDLSPLENPWPDRDLRFKRSEIGGSPQGTICGHKKRGPFVAIRDGTNMAPMRTGECGIFFCGRANNERLKGFDEFPVFAAPAGDESHNWQYRGQYHIVNGGLTAPGSLKGMDVNRKAEVLKVLKANFSWFESWIGKDGKVRIGLREDWRVSATTPQGALDELDRGDTAAGMRYSIMKCCGFNQEFYDYWDKERKNPGQRERAEGEDKRAAAEVKEAAAEEKKEKKERAKEKKRAEQAHSKDTREKKRKREELQTWM